MATGKQRRQGVEVRAAVWAARHPGVLGASGSVAASVAELGPVTTGSIAAGVLTAGVGWVRAHPASFDRYGAPLLRGWCRRWVRYVGPRWISTLTACELIKDDRRTGAPMVPRVLRVAAPTPTIDRVTVRMVRGQSLRTWQDAHDELAAALKADSLGITRLKAQVLVLTVVRGNPFTDRVPAAAIPDHADGVDFTAVEFGETEYGQVWTEPVLGHHLLGCGATGSGKSGLFWNPLRAMAPAIRDGVVRVWMVDPKGGMETARARPIFHRYADHIDDDDEDDGPGPAYQGEAALDVVQAFRDHMRRTQAALSGQGKRKCRVSSSTPYNVLIIDELAMCTALSSRSATNTLTRLLAEIMTQGRAAGFSVWAFVQEPTKDIVPIRDLFTRRITLRTTTASYVDMVLRDGAWMDGALADDIPADDEHAGIGFRVDDRSRNPVRVRVGNATDDDIDELVRIATPPNHHGDGRVVPFPIAV